MRRGSLVFCGALLVGAACAVAPWVAATVIVLAVWLLRSGSLAASAAGDRRLRRGRKWYDGAQVVVHTPWHLVQSIPGTLMLVLWAAGLAVSAALICYAVAAGDAVTLFASGLVLAGSLWWGPGGSRLRSPLNRVVVPVARSGRLWVAGRGPATPPGSGPGPDRRRLWGPVVARHGPAVPRRLPLTSRTAGLPLGRGEVLSSGRCAERRRAGTLEP